MLQAIAARAPGVSIALFPDRRDGQRELLISTSQPQRSRNAGTEEKDVIHGFGLFRRPEMADLEKHGAFSFPLTIHHHYQVEGGK